MDPKPTSQKYAKNFCKEHNLNPEFWGFVNDAICDGHFQCRMEFNPLVILFEEKAIEEIKACNREKAETWLIAARTIKEITLNKIPVNKAFKYASNQKEINEFFDFFTSQDS